MARVQNDSNEVLGSNFVKDGSLWLQYDPVVRDIQFIGQCVKS